MGGKGYTAGGRVYSMAGWFSTRETRRPLRYMTRRWIPTAAMSWTRCPSSSPLATRTIMLDRPHPLTGEPVIYAPFGTCMGITGLSDEAAFALLSKLAAHCVQTKYQYQHIHEHGVLLIYDNHQMAHRSSPQQKAAEDMNTLRLLYRISTKINATSEWYGKT